MWTYEIVETTMDVVEKGTYSLRKAKMSWNIPLNSLSNHLNNKTRSMKIEPRGVLT
jgi:hypothetical protein